MDGPILVLNLFKLGVVLIAGAVHFLQECEAASSNDYVLFASDSLFMPAAGLANATGICQRTALGLNLPQYLTASFPVLWGSIVVVNWVSGVQVIVHASGATVASSDVFRAGFPPLNQSLADLGICGGNVWTGLGGGFVQSGTGSCSTWTSTSGNARTGDCSEVLGWISSGNVAPCTINPATNMALQILCVYNGTTASPTKSPSSAPTLSPTISAPSTSPTRPTTSPTTGMPSRAPSTSIPTRSPSKQTFRPTTPVPTHPDDEVANTASGLRYTTPLTVGIVCGLASVFMVVLVVRVVRRRRRQVDAAVAVPGETIGADGASTVNLTTATSKRHPRHSRQLSFRERVDSSMTTTSAK